MSLDTLLPTIGAEPVALDDWINGITDWVAGSQPVPVPGGRLSVVSGTPVPTTETSNATTLYYLPYTHGVIHLHDASLGWMPHNMGAGITQALSVLSTAARPHDVFIWDNAGTLTMEFVVWTSDTARATELALQDGIFVKTGDTTRRYVGTIRNDNVTATQTHDTLILRFVYNFYNRVQFPFQWASGDDVHTWTPGSDTYRAWNNNSNARSRIMLGQPGPIVAGAIIAGWVMRTGGALSQIGASLNGTGSAERFVSGAAPVQASSVVDATQAGVALARGVSASARLNDVYLHQRQQSGGSGWTYNFGLVSGFADL